MTTPLRPPLLVKSPSRSGPAAPEVVEVPLLRIAGLKTHFKTDDGWLHAVDGVDIAIDRGQTVCVVGESGCGKTVTAMTVLKLLPMPPGRIVAGQVLWQGRDLVKASNDEMRRVRAKEIAIVFQEPMTSLNPVYTVGEQIAESLRLHEGLGRKAALDRAVEMLALVRIPTPQRRVHDYPHQFSGGMRQRVMIAMALACNPQLLIADEPTTALDVTIQAQILDLLAELKQRLGMAIMLITHAMGVVAEVAQRVVVMYAGMVVEEATRRGTVREPAPSVHARADPLDPAHRHGGAAQDAPRADSRHRAEADRARRGLPLRAALPLRRARVHRGDAGAARARAGAQGALHLRHPAERRERGVGAHERAAARGQGPRQAIPDRRRLARPRGRERACGRAASASISRPARRSASSANRAAARHDRPLHPAPDRADLGRGAGSTART